MLDKKRIEEAQKNVKSYLADGLLKKTATTKDMIAILTQNAKESLKAADELYQNRTSDLWVIVCSYYAMFYYANAVLIRLGYKVGGQIVHKVTSDAIIVYVRGKLKESLLEEYEEIKEEALNMAGVRADNLIATYDYERDKRSLIQYETTSVEKQSKAATSLQRAKEFSIEMSKLLLD